MKKVIRIDEWATINGSINEVEITFEDKSKAIYKGIESRKGNKHQEVSRIDEWRTPEGELIELEITFTNNETILYKGNNIIRKGTI